MKLSILKIFKDYGTLKDGTKWEGVRLLVREVKENEARTYIAKASRDFDSEDAQELINTKGVCPVDCLYYDRFGRIIGYELVD